MATLKTDIEEVRRSLEILKPQNELVEIRAYDSKKNITSGYFSSNYSELLKQLANLQYDNCYFTLNHIDTACYSRSQHETLEKYVKTTTSDKDITIRQWLLIDADPIRVSGISSTDEEKNASRITLGKIYNYLRDLGFSYPVVADSGNGYHLLYNVNIKSIEGATQLIKEFLQSLDVMFSDDKTSIDTSVFNPSRITKLYGTVAKKGANTADRPHRISRLVKVPELVKITNIDLIKKVADLLPKPILNTQKQNYPTSNFDIDSFISRNMGISRMVNSTMGTKYILESCPFDSSHKAPDSMIAVLNNGAIGFKCLHNGCADKKWEDVREMFDPKHNRSVDRTRTTEPIASTNVQPSVKELELPVKKYLQLHEIENVDRSQIVSLATGITALDCKIVGLNKKEVTVISGNNGSAKSTIIGQWILNHINNGFKCTLFSGELNSSRVKNWLHLQAAGRQFNKKSQYGESVYYTPKDIGEKIDQWAVDKFFLHNNLTGIKFSDILKTIEETIREQKTDIIYIDNLMAIDLSEVTGDKYERQTNVILKLTSLAKTHDVHIVFICHPRKPIGFLRKEDISGTADLTNAVDNVIMCHRINDDFKKNAITFLDKTKINDFVGEGYTNCIEVMKNRDIGIQDELIGMYFEPESKRLLNNQHENFVFGWQGDLVEVEIPDDEMPFL